jgi:hypothetical protein
MLMFQKIPLINSASMGRATSGEYWSTFSYSSHIPTCSNAVFTSHAWRHNLHRQAHKNSICGKVSTGKQHSSNKVIVTWAHEEMHKV